MLVQELFRACRVGDFSFASDILEEHPQSHEARTEVTNHVSLRSLTASIADRRLASHRRSGQRFRKPRPHADPQRRE